jgi:hypothetical protein
MYDTDPAGVYFFFLVTFGFVAFMSILAGAILGLIGEDRLATWLGVDLEEDER